MRSLVKANIFCGKLYVCLTATSFAMHAQVHDSVTIEIKNPGKEINSAFADYAPVISADGSVMIFTSRRPVSEKEIRKNSASTEHIFSSEFDLKTHTWSNAFILPGTVNIRSRNNSAIALSNDGQQMLTYHDDINGNGDIYQSKLNGTQWTEAVSLGEPINSKYHESSAGISPDGKTIYFVSDRPGGAGGRDIWCSTKNEKGQWGNAINMGAPVNTDKDEEGVFAHPDGKTIYFSSKGNEGFGGYDIYRSVFKNGVWGTPENLGEPLNTDGDDVFFVMHANGMKGYYSSSIAGGAGDKDIYEVTFIPVKKEKPPVGPALTLLKGLVLDEEKLTPVEAFIEIVDNEKHEIISTFSSNSSSGKFLVSLPAGKNYGIAVKAENYLFYSDNFNLPDTAAYREIERNVLLKKLVVGKKIVLKNIFYDFDKATLRPESVSELDRMVSLMSQNASITIEVSSYTDSKGADEYNKKLSQARAQAVVDYLINKGISKERLTAIGFGEAFPIAENETEEGRQLNRRTEFKILSK
ncbi:MAG TPA: OmpA family protein [Bacteroidia bacterium]|nr:OmpA family protein [Bacteroidia bacterium]